MYKLLIVDDEKIVIEGLKSATNWKEHHIEIVGSASDGEEAFKEIINKKPDIVLADIRIPKMNGLDLIKETKNLNLETVFIIISGYSKFDYAKRAIQLEAIDYLVKPIEVDEIVCSIKKAILKLEKIKNEKQTTERINEYQIALEEKRVLDYILGHRFVDPEIDQKLNRFSFLTIGLKGFTWDDSKETKKLQVPLGCMKNLLENRGIESFIYTIDSQIVIMFSNSCLEIRNDLVHDLVSLIFHDIKFKPIVGISNVHENISEIKKAYSEAKEALKNGIFSNQLVTYYKELETFNHSFGNSIIEEINQFFNEKNPDLLSRMNLFMAKVFLDCKKSNLSPEKSKYLCFKIVNHFLEYIEREYEVKNIGGERYLLYEELNLLQSLEEIRDWLEQFIDQSTEFLNEHHVSYNEKLIIDLKSFINTNYKEPIVLDDLGKLFHKNPAYLCSLFSKAVGNTIFEYITNVRLNNAKKLLRTSNLKVSEICKQVGYENQKYFNQVFKKNIGTTPGLYRSQHILK
ncbi:response regulator [Bacillus sp. ISL-40]|uniref:response regulator n=1 Tax=unclassified Bacillus (in: firmicutes) TaxID=185979 RepID=UPI001BE79578|nr:MULTISPECIES: response regulator [unclassified Bacillus (in: firmicutes)]MBT2696804.1 response regulator [Bacillus sp. ISL-40]MBT2721193.1 response regulator [Bacillus sp. ISL-46]MBT2740120.1 response regulator [Bacillus sp. ISL-77]